VQHWWDVAGKRELKERTSKGMDQDSEYTVDRNYRKK
jgi:hypothetical protein